jgi:hypothetical protein
VLAIRDHFFSLSPRGCLGLGRLRLFRGTLVCSWQISIPLSSCTSVFGIFGNVGIFEYLAFSVFRSFGFPWNSWFPDYLEFRGFQVFIDSAGFRDTLAYLHACYSSPHASSLCCSPSVPLFLDPGPPWSRPSTRMRASSRHRNIIGLWITRCYFHSFNSITINIQCSEKGYTSVTKFSF